MDRATIEGEVVSNGPSSGPKPPGVGGPEGFAVDSPEDAALNCFTPGFTPAELRDFLAADHLESYADPGFKERLRKKLWDFIRNRYGPGSSSSDSS